MKILQLRLFIYSSILLLHFTGCRTTKDPYADIPVIALEALVIESNPVYKGSAKKDFILKHTRLESNPDWQTRTLNGKAVLTLEVGAYAQDTLVLDARSMVIDPGIELSHNKNTTALTANDFRYDRRKLYINLPENKPGDEFIVTIRYVAHPEVQIEEGLIDKVSDQGLYFVDPDNSDSIVPRQMWTQGEVKNNSAWFPTIDEPNQKMTQDIYLTVDTSLVTLSNGELVYSNLNHNGTRTDYWQMEQPHAPYLAMIAAGEWTVTRDEWRDSIPVEYYLEKRFESNARTIFGTTPAMMEFFSNRLGIAYPWPKFSQVVAREFVTGAMENTTAVVHYEPVQHDARQHLDNTQEDIIAHELFHHWFGDMVTCESWAQVALNESLATLGESLWLEHRYGHDEAALHLKDNLDAYLSEAVYTMDAIINHYYTSADNLFDAHRYQKGALVMNMLRNYLGDTIFFASLKKYLLDNAFGNVELSDLRKAFETTSGQDLQWFFTQWFEKPGHPIIQVQHDYQPADARYRVIVTQQQTGQNIPVFRVPVDISVYETVTHVKSYPIWLKNWSDTFYFSSATEPIFVNFDPTKNLLCKKTEIKSRTQWYNQFLYGSAADKAEALGAFNESEIVYDRDSLITLIRMGLQHPFWHVRKRTIEILLYDYDKSDKYVDVFGLKTLVKTDPNSKVRAAALGHLARMASESGSFYEALSDSSYLVVATGIRALLHKEDQSDSLMILASLLPLESLHGSEVLLAIAEAYTKYPLPGKEPFLHHAYSWMPSQSMSRYVDAYRKYLSTQPISALIREQVFILGMGSHIRDLWSTILYRNMLLAFAQSLENVNDVNLQFEGREIAERFRLKADSYKMEQ